MNLPESMSLNIGKKIKEVFESKQMKLKDFAESAGVARQNVYRIFEKESIDTALLSKISIVLKHDFYQYFQNEDAEKAAVSSFAEEKNQLLRELDFYKSEAKLAKKEIDYLKKIIELMEERTKLLLVKSH
jgi:transcriptional regulator with XRE-family HTH domain